MISLQIPDVVGIVFDELKNLLELDQLKKLFSKKIQSFNGLTLLFYAGIPFLFILTLLLLVVLKVTKGKIRNYMGKIIDFIFLDLITRIFVASFLNLCIDANIKNPCLTL